MFCVRYGFLLSILFKLLFHHLPWVGEGKGKGEYDWKGVPKGWMMVLVESITDGNDKKSGSLWFILGLNVNRDHLWY